MRSDRRVRTGLMSHGAQPRLEQQNRWREESHAGRPAARRCPPPPGTPADAQGGLAQLGGAVRPAGLAVGVRQRWRGHPARTVTYATPAYAAVARLVAPVAARATYVPAQTAYVWTSQPVRQTGPSYNWSPVPSTPARSTAAPSAPPQSTTAYYASAQ